MTTRRRRAVDVVGDRAEGVAFPRPPTLATLLPAEILRNVVAPVPMAPKRPSQTPVAPRNLPNHRSRHDPRSSRTTAVAVRTVRIGTIAVVTHRRSAQTIAVRTRRARKMQRRCRPRLRLRRADWSSRGLPRRSEMAARSTCHGFMSRSLVGTIVAGAAVVDA